MEDTPGHGEDHHVNWADPHNGVVRYQQIDPGTSSFDGTASSEMGFNGLQALQRVFVTIQTSAEDNSYQSMQNDVGYQSVYMTSTGAGAFERISPDVDYGVPSDVEGLSLDAKHQYIQVPFILGNHSHSPSGSNQYCVLNSYLQNLGSSVVGTSLSSAVISDGMSLQNVVSQGLNSCSTTHDGNSESSSVIHMGLPNSFNSDGNSPYLQLSLDSRLEPGTSLQSNVSLNGGRGVSLTRPARQSDPQDAGEADVLQQLLADGDEDDDVIQAPLEITMMNSRTNDGNHELTATRKSARIANKERGTSPIQFAKYISKPYNNMELWCEDCQKSYAEECDQHKLQPLGDKVVLSRAWASLPPNLQIFRLVQSTDDFKVSEMGVFAKRSIPKRTQFGPIIAPTVSHPDLLISRKFLLLVDNCENNSCEYYDPADENMCNWMMFIRPATVYAEQNLVAYQYRTEIYFSTTSDIQPGQELKVWYAAHYAERLQVELLHKPDVPDPNAVELPWSCYECSERFQTAALMQNHLSIHDDDIAAEDNSQSEYDGLADTSRPRRGRKRNNNRLQQDDETRLSSPIELSDPLAPVNGSGDPNEFQSWKKRKTNLYLKMKKYKEPIKRSIRTLAKKSRVGAIGISCSQCEMLFERQELLQIHMLSHTTRVFNEELPFGQASVTSATGNDCNGDGVRNELTCPSCRTSFNQLSLLVAHVASHSVSRRHRRNKRGGASETSSRTRPYKCLHCWKAFESEEKLRRHMLSHTDSLKPLKCDVCEQRFMNNSALSCHKKIHSNQQYYSCPLCHERFDQITVLRAHSESHADPTTGVFSCPWCHKFFETYESARRHARAFHSLTSYPCPECGKSFPRPDKLKLHLLRHSSHREFMCETCGRQFKRKDKMREHVKRAHDPNSLKPSAREAKTRYSGSKTFDAFAAGYTPGSRPTSSDYEKFIYKCHDCQLGFKRRGMLINHMAKRHPEVSLNSIPELSLPILHSQRDFYCQYCDKVYKSSSKRKAHITKSHPGAELPPSGQRRVGVIGSGESGLPNPTYSATVGSVMSVPHACELCHKQYSTKAKLLQHFRSKHAIYNSSSNTVNESTYVQLQTTQAIVDSSQPSGSNNVLMITRQVVPQSVSATATSSAGELTEMQSDILTQAMTELTRSFGAEYRVVSAMPGMNAGEYHTIVPCVVNVSSEGAALVQSIPGMMDSDNGGYAATIMQSEPDSAGYVSETDLTSATQGAFDQNQTINWNVLTGSESFQSSTSGQILRNYRLV